MIQMRSNSSFTAIMGAKTFNLDQHEAGHWCVTSYATAEPCAKIFWGCKTFPTLAAVEEHYKAFRGLRAMIGALQIAA